MPKLTYKMYDSIEAGFGNVFRKIATLIARPISIPVLMNMKSIWHMKDIALLQKYHFVIENAKLLFPLSNREYN